MFVAFFIAAVSIAAIVWRLKYPLAKFWPRLLQKVISLFALVSVIGVVGWFVMVAMPGRSFHGPVPELVNERAERRGRLEADVTHLSVEIGERNVHCDSRGLLAAQKFVEERFVELGYEPKAQDFKVGGVVCANVEVEIVGSERPEEIVVIGAHYDSAPGTPGANDNASGTAAGIQARSASCVVSSVEKGTGSDMSQPSKLHRCFTGRCLFPFLDMPAEPRK